MINKIKSINLYFYLTFFIIFTALIYLFCNTDNDIIIGDGAEYYRYFTSIFIDNNFNDNNIYKYPVGTGVLQLPFLLISLLVSSFFNIDYEGGYSLLFQKTVLFASEFYCIVGLMILYKIIEKYFSNKVASITSLSLFFGTMLIFYAAYQASYSHIYGFFTCALFMWYTIFYEEKYKSSANKVILNILLGFILALACLVRYTNFIIIFLYIFYDVSTLSELKKRFRIIFSKKIIYQFLSFICIFSIQFLLYKLCCGNFILHGYGDEKFIYFTNPQIYKVLFSLNKGLFIYCPILFLGFLAMLLLNYKNNKFKISQLLIFAILTYIISSWWCWWLGYGYSERLYCDFLCIFTLPIATAINIVFESCKSISKYLIRIMIIIFVSLSVALNLIWIQGILCGEISSNLASWYMLKMYLLQVFGN